MKELGSVNLLAPVISAFDNLKPSVLVSDLLFMSVFCHFGMPIRNLCVKLVTEDLDVIYAVRLCLMPTAIISSWGIYVNHNSMARCQWTNASTFQRPLIRGIVTRELFGLPAFAIS